jgi:hypothetical protein
VLFPEILIFLEDNSLCIGFLEGDFLAKKKKVNSISVMNAALLF